jgi:hypothetical protein
MLIAIISCNQVICSADEYKLLGLEKRKESICGYEDIIINGVSNSVAIKKIFYAAEIPVYDTKNGFFLGAKQCWLQFEEYERLTKIVDRIIDETTEFPIQLKAYYENGFQNVDTVFLLRWVPAQQKKAIQLKAEENERKQRRLHQSTLQNMSESLLGSWSSKNK